MTDYSNGVEFEMLPHQKAFIYSKSKYTLNSGGVGSGKTFSLILKTLKLMIEYPGILVLIGARTFPMLRETTLREWNKLVPNQIVKKQTIAPPNIKLKNGSEVLFRSFDDPNKLKSLNLGAFCIEEMSDISEDIFLMLQTRLRQIDMPQVGYGATNPGTFGNWVYRTFIETPIPDSEVVYSKTIDNTYLDDGYINAMNQIQITNPAYYKRMVEGHWGALEGLIYNLPDSQRISELPQEFHRYVAGLDFGFTDSPTALVIMGVIDKTFYIVDEFYRHKMTSGDIVKEVKEKMNKYSINTIYCDSARPEIIEDLKRAGIPAQGAIKSVDDGILWVQTTIGEKRLFVNRDCTYTLREFDSYVIDKKNTVKPTPLKVNDHCMDAVRYAIYTDYKKHFEFVRIGPEGYFATPALTTKGSSGNILSDMARREKYRRMTGR